jgi:hypothetical protein
MRLVLCHLTDLPALWAYRELKAAGVESLEVITAEALAYSLVWEHRLGTGETLVRVRLGDGRVIDSHDVQGVLNRLVYVPLEHWQLGTPADRDYVTQEFTAFYLSWLYALPCSVFGRPSPLGLAGPWRHASEWAALAQRAGLPAARYHQTSDEPPDETGGMDRLAAPDLPRVTLIAVAGEVVVAAPVAAAPPGVAEGCLRLAALADTELLGVDFAVAPNGQWLFAGANSLPDLSLGGGALIGALARAFTKA